MSLFDIHDLKVGVAGNWRLRLAHLVIPEGKFVAVIGANGSGKTTLLKTLVGLLQPTGSVSLRGQDLAAVTWQQRSREIAWVPHSSAPAFAIRVKELVCQGRYSSHRGWPQSQDWSEVGAALAALDLADFSERMVHTLSAGELKKAHIARGLASGCRILVLDEPCAHLDLGASERLLHYLQTIQRRRALSIVASLHDLRQVTAFADEVIALSSGELVLQGAPDLLSHDKIKAIFDLPVTWPFPD